MRCGNIQMGGLAELQEKHSIFSMAQIKGLSEVVRHYLATI